jgi:hypothetical protein
VKSSDVLPDEAVSGQILRRPIDDSQGLVLVLQERLNHFDCPSPRLAPHQIYTARIVKLGPRSMRMSLGSEVAIASRRLRTLTAMHASMVPASCVARRR